jgi:hypothetical protein
MQFQSIQGPTDPNLRHSEIEGYQPVSRIGEIVINSFIDSYEFAALPTHITHSEMMNSDKESKTPDEIKALKDALTAAKAADPQVPADIAAAQAEYDKWKDYKHDDQIEQKPHFHEWATALPGMICVSRKARNSTFRNYVAAETATPVVACCACLKMDEESNFYFAGVCRSKSVRPMDDGVGPSVDEFFTIAIGGMVTLLNNSGTSVFPGDMLEWTFYNESMSRKTGASTRKKADPRRISIRMATATSERVIGRCLSFAKPGETFDLLLKSC